MVKEKTDAEIAASPNPADQKREALKQVVPEAISEGKVDVEALKRALGEELVVDGGERYRLDWVGKSEAYKVLQTPTTATLRPRRDQSVNFDTASHVFIEGENLETLKVLQKAYFGKVKLIYIDPPYNTGNDTFVYPDRFQESKEDYLKRINELDDDGSLMREGFFRKNSRESGHYHSNWLSMMLPRLYIARNLLHEEGVILVSCDDNEFYNLRCLLNEIFGEDNFIGTIVWKNATDNNPTRIAVEHEYIVCYARNQDLAESNWKSSVSAIKEKLIDKGKYFLKNFKPDELQEAYTAWYRKNKSQLGPLDRYKYIDEEGIYTGSQSVHNPGREGYRYDVIHPETGKPCKEPLMGYRFPKETMDELLATGKILFGEDENKIIELKVYAEEFEEKVSSVFELDGRLGMYDIRRDFPDMTKPFNNPKPVGLLSRLIQVVATDPGDIVLDFFAGSGTTAIATWEANRTDHTMRRWVLVQLPEKIDKDHESYKHGFRNIAELTCARIRGFIDRHALNTGQEGELDANELQFRRFCLMPSSFKQWRGDDIESGEDLADQIKLFMQSEKDGAESDAVLHELLLKFGYELTTPVEILTIGKHPVYSVNNCEMMMILDEFNEAMIGPLIERKPEQLIVLDTVFRDSDPLKSNVALQCRDAGVRFTCL